MPRLHCQRGGGRAAGLTAGRNPLLRKQGGKVSLRNFEQRDQDGRLGKPDELTGVPAPIIDVAHGVLWRAEFRDRELRGYLTAVRPDVELLRTVVQALAGKAPEAAAAERLLVGWRRLAGDNLILGDWGQAELLPWHAGTSAFDLTSPEID